MIKYYKLEGMRSIPCTIQEWIIHLSTNSVLLSNKKDTIIVYTYHKGSIDPDVHTPQMYKTVVYEITEEDRETTEEHLSSTYEEAETIHRLVCERLGIIDKQKDNDLS